MTLKELYERKRNAYAVCRGLLDQAAKEDGRPLTAEENVKYDAAEKEMDDTDVEIQAKEAAIRREQRLARAAEDMTRSEPVRVPALSNAGTDGASVTDHRSLAEKFNDLLDQGCSRKEALDKIIADKNEQTKIESQAFRQWLRQGFIDPSLRERAALRVDDAAGGGFLVMPERFIAQLIKELDRRMQIRQVSTVISVTDAESLGVPTLENRIADPTWTTELKVGNPDTTMSFGKRALTPHPLAQYIRVSKDFLRKAVIDGETIVRNELAYKFAYVEESAFHTGSGAKEPLGVFTASSYGISTAQDVSTDNTTTAVTTDGLINCKYSLPSQYLESLNLRWLFHRTVVRDIRKLKDGNGQYIWQPGLSVDRGNTILDVPVMMGEFAPNTMTTGLYVGLIGDFSYYWIVDQLSMQIQRLQELYALTNEDAFIGRLASDGMPVLEQAFARVTLA